MNKLAACMLAATLTVAPLLAQTANQDAKNAGHETAAATKDTGHAISKGTKTTYRKSKHGTKKAGSEVADKTEDAYDATKHGTAVAATKTARGTKSIAKKITGDKSPTTTPHDPPKKY